LSQIGTAIDLGDTIKQKISLFGSLPVENIIEAKDVGNIYEIPMVGLVFNSFEPNRNGTRVV